MLVISGTLIIRDEISHRIWLNMKNVDKHCNFMYVSRPVRNVGELSCISVYCMVSKEAYHDIDSILKTQGIKLSIIKHKHVQKYFKYRNMSMVICGMVWVVWEWSLGGFGYWLDESCS